MAKETLASLRAQLQAKETELAKARLERDEVNAALTFDALDTDEARFVRDVLLRARENAEVFRLPTLDTLIDALA